MRAAPQAAAVKYELGNEAHKATDDNLMYILTTIVVLGLGLTNSQSLPVVQRMADRLGDKRLAGHARELLLVSRQLLQPGIFSVSSSFSRLTSETSSPPYLPSSHRKSPR